MNRDTENAALLLVGLSIGMVTVTGAFTRYVKPSLLPWLLAAALLLIAFGLATIAGDARGGPSAFFGEDRHWSAITWLLAVPIVVLIFVVPPALGAGAATPTVVAVSTEVLRRPFPPLPAGRAPVVSLPDVLQRLTNDTAGTLNNRLVTVTGFVQHDHNATYLARVVIVCCAADALLARVRLTGTAATGAAGSPDNSWVSIEGIATSASAPTRGTASSAPGPTFGTPSSAAGPTLEVTTLTRIDPPANTYAYYSF